MAMVGHGYNGLRLYGHVGHGAQQRVINDLVELCE
jgi:hypothetical protein